MKINQITKMLATACMTVIALASTTTVDTAWARGGNGGHAGGGHCSGHSFSGGHSFSHVSCTHVSSIHSFCNHTGTSHTSVSHVIGLTRCSSRNAIIDVTSHSNCTTIPTMFPQNTQVTPSSTSVSSMVRRSSHCGLLGHLHRLFASPAQVAAVVSDNYLMPLQQQNDFVQAPANESAVEITPATASTLERQIDTTVSESDSNTTDATLQKLSVSSVLLTDKLPAMSLCMEVQPQNYRHLDERINNFSEGPIFKGLSYMLPNSGGILNTCFAQKNSLQRFFLQMENSYLWFALHHLP